VKSLKPKQKPL